MTDILLVHGNELAREKFIKATGANVTLIHLEGSSSAYDEYAQQNPRINGPIILVAFSAGVWALRRWLRDPSNREQVTAVVILDGLYGAPGSICNLQPYDGIIAYGRSRKKMILSYSSAHPDTAICSMAVAEASGSSVDIIGSSSTDHNAQLTEVGPRLVGELVKTDSPTPIRSKTSSGAVALIVLAILGIGYGLIR